MSLNEKSLSSGLCWDFRLLGLSLATWRACSGTHTALFPRLAMDLHGWLLHGIVAFAIGSQYLGRQKQMEESSQELSQSMGRTVCYTVHAFCS